MPGKKLSSISSLLRSESKFHCTRLCLLSSFWESVNYVPVAYWRERGGWSNQLATFQKNFGRLCLEQKKILNEAQRAEFKLKGIHYFREKWSINQIHRTMCTKTPKRWKVFYLKFLSLITGTLKRYLSTN